MAFISMSTRINAPQQRVFALFTDLHSASANIKAIDKIEVLTEGPIGKGTRFAETRTMFGRPQTETLHITDWNPPHSYTVDLESCGMRYTTHFAFKADGDQAEATIVDMTFNATPLHLAAKLMGFTLLFMKSTFRKLFERDLADLKAVAEASPPAPEPLAA